MGNNTMAKTKNTSEVSKAFSWFHATSVNGGAMMIAAVLASYLSPFMTDNLKIPAATCSLIMFIATLWDAINDPIMGVIADNTHTKIGRYRPYFLFAPVLLTFFATMVWIDWGFTSSAAKAIYILVMYIGYGMTVTMYTMPQMAILPAAVKKDQERNKIITMGAGCCAFAFTIGNTFTQNITGFFNGLGFSNGYIPFMIVCGVLAFVSFWGLFKTSEGQERYLSAPEKNPMKGIGMVLKHKEVYPNIIAWVMASVGYGLMFASSVYYMMYYYERPDLIPVYMGVISIGALISMVVAMPVVLKIFKTGQRALCFSQAATIVTYLILFFFGKSNFAFLCVLTFIGSVTGAMQNALVNILVNDTIDFIMYKEGKSANGLVSSIKGFAQKCGNTVTNSGILAILAMSGYVAGAVGQQPESAMFALNFIKFGAPCITGLIVIACVVFGPIKKYKNEIEEMKRKMHSEEVVNKEAV
ncbi:MFS transporter [Butyrivibrio sp. XPD2002]|uniref:MFS transporter n=1 Tax=Butyrivibrio sp. XPD2002 TaxID=1280665 RepID=UPI000414E78D|nr:MFS transporter [Butyrivibrio sp. XPD2002]